MNRIAREYSRHYYDVAMLAGREILSEALADKTLLAQVVRHKQTFYSSAWARYDVARYGGFASRPPRSALESWKGITEIWV